LKSIGLSAFCLLHIFYTQAQEVTQTISGKITEQVSGKGVAQAHISLIQESEVSFQTLSDEQGNFKIEQVSIGRYRLEITHASYYNYSTEVFVQASKELSISINLRERVYQLDEVQVVASGAGVTSIPGITELSIEKATRLAANYYDPVRVSTAYPGVLVANDQNNAIIVRGNSPEGLLWRLNGLDVLNPNHLSNAGSLGDRPAANGGGVNMLSTQMLGTTKFITGNYAPSYGNLQSAVVDMELRESGNPVIAHTLQASLIGIDYASEGTLIPDKLSYTFNARFSTVGLLSLMGIDFGGESISFSDAAGQLVYRTKNNGILKGFFVMGYSKNDFKSKPQDDWEEDKDRFDIQYEGNTTMTGLTYSSPLKGDAQLNLGIGYSRSKQNRYADFMGNPDRPLRWDDLQQDNQLLSQFITYRKRISSSTWLEAGNYLNYYQTDLFLYEYPTLFDCLFCAQPKEGIDDVYSSWQNATYLQAQQNLGRRWLITAALRGVGNNLYDKYFFEPRVSLQWDISEKQQINFAYTNFNRLQSPSIYLSNKDQELLPIQSNQLTLDYALRISDDLSLRSTAFYQHLSDVPVQPNSTYSVLNLMEPVERRGLINEGEGENYGVDLILEKSFYNNFYFLTGGSLYRSTYRDGNNTWRPTRFDGNYTLNLSAGKEWSRSMSNARKSFAIDTRFLYVGGLNEMPILETFSAWSGKTVFNEPSGYSERIPDYKRFDLRLSWRKHKPNYTRSLILDIQNVFSLQNVAYHYYDAYKLQRSTQYNLGIIPVLAYRVEF
jgi:hypothetical protein